MSISNFLTIWFVIELFLFIGLLLLFSFYKKPIISKSTWKKFTWFAQDSRRVVLFLFLTYSVFNLTYYLVAPPLPIIVDEFSYIFQAETFLEGRLINETPKMWEHFETFFIVQEPFFISKFQPGQAAFLALGKLLSGKFIVGIWFSYFLATMAFYWMLKQWTTKVWAFIGTLIFCLNGQIFLEWGNGFWGGALPMMGGALIFGAIKNIANKKLSLKTGVFLAVGLSALAYTRPYEGLISSFLLILPIIKFQVFSNNNLQILLKKLIVPVSILMTLSIGFLIYYNKSVTGDYFSLPYNLYHTQYETSRSFVFQKAHDKPHYNHIQMEKFHDNESKRFFSRKSSIGGYLYGVFVKVIMFSRYYIRAAFLIPFVFFLFLRKNYWEKYALTVVLVLFFANLITTWEETHYLAPISAIFIFLVIRGFKKMYSQKSIFIPYVNTIIIMILLSPILGLASHYKKEKTKFTRDKEFIEQKLSQNETKDLVIVKYDESHPIPNEEWVYNHPNFQKADVLWARDLGQERNKELTKAYPERKCWLIYPDSNPIKLIDYQRDSKVGLSSKPFPPQ